MKLILALLAFLAAGFALGPDDTQRQAAEQERQCLALVGFAEARSDGDAAMSAVMQVAINRANDPAARWPRNVCAVVMQPAQFLAIRSVRPSAQEYATWRRALDLADMTRAGSAQVPGACVNATSFHQAASVPGLVPVCRLASHTFFVEPRIALAESPPERRRSP